MGKRIICQRCVHYFVTWMRDQPHGCRGYGFTSKQIPSAMVKRSSGDDCMMFEEKPLKK